MERHISSLYLFLDLLMSQFHDYSLSLIEARAVTKNGFCEQKQSVESTGTDALISAKNAEIRQIEPYAVRLAEALNVVFSIFILAMLNNSVDICLTNNAG